HEDQGRQLETAAVPPPDGAEVLPEAPHPARDAVKLPLDPQQRYVIELHRWRPPPARRGPCRFAPRSTDHDTASGQRFGPNRHRPFATIPNWFHWISS